MVGTHSLVKFKKNAIFKMLESYDPKITEDIKLIYEGYWRDIYGVGFGEDYLVFLDGQPFHAVKVELNEVTKVMDFDYDCILLEIMFNKIILG